MNEELLELLDLVIEYFNNTDAAGDYDGDDPRLIGDGINTILSLAYKVRQQEQMRIWNI